MSDIAIKNNRRPGHRRPRGSKRARHSMSDVIAPVILKLFGVFMLLVAFNLFREFPSFGYGFIAISLVYLVALFFLPHIWLIVLPLATVSLDLATYTGRFLFNEYDLLFITTIAYGLISGRFSLGFLKPGWAILLIGIYCLIVLSGFSAWSVFFHPPAAALSNPYYLSEYGYKVIKGMLWALMLAPMWIDLYKVCKEKTINWLVIGQCLAALLLGLIVLWERGTLGVLLSGSAWYHMVSSLLDLSSSYRTTGIFSDMHTGGEVVDGVILLLLPIVLYGVCRGTNPFIRVLALVAFGSLAYCTMVGFTRATYVSFFVGIAAFWVLYLVSRRYSEGDDCQHPYWLYGLATVLAFVAAYFAFLYAGSFGVAAYAGLVVSAFAGGWLLVHQRWLAIGCWAIGAGVFLTVAISAHYNSRWAERSDEAVFILTSLLLVFYLFAVSLFARLNNQSNFNRFIVAALLIMLPAGFSLAFGGYKFNERMVDVTKDMGSRMTHWRHVVQSSEGGIISQLFGNGSGTFPANYVYHFPDTVRDVGSYSVNRGNYETHLSMGPGEDLAFGQRVALKPNTDYNLALNIRADKKGRVAVFVCERNLIFASNFMANCEAVSIRFNPTANEFERHTAILNTGTVGKRHRLSRWPTTLYIKNFSKEAVVDIGEVYFGLEGKQELKNPDFSKGTDHWFFYNDFAHLPWHIKNTYLQAWYNQGWVGLGLFLGLGMATVFAAVNRRNPTLYVAFATGIVAIAAFGLFGSPLDSPRVSWLFYFYIFVSLFGGTKVSGETNVDTEVLHHHNDSQSVPALDK